MNFSDPVHPLHPANPASPLNPLHPIHHHRDGAGRTFDTIEVLIALGLVIAVLAAAVAVALWLESRF